jgi:hypothetical protein
MIAFELPLLPSKHPSLQDTPPSKCPSNEKYDRAVILKMNYHHNQIAIIIIEDVLPEERNPENIQAIPL